MNFPKESPCFLIRVIEWEIATPPGWLRRQADLARGQCIGIQGLKILQEDLQRQSIQRGAITARVMLAQQSLGDGVLRIAYLPGTIADIHDEGMPGYWRMALPGGPGSHLDRHDLDQALETIRRLRGQADAAVEVREGARFGETEVVLKPGTGKWWHGYVGYDNAGLASTGRNQLSAGLSIDSPLRLYDQLSLAWNGSAGLQNRNAGARSASISYSVPFGYAMAFADYSQSSYQQTIAGFSEPIVYRGTSRQLDWGLSYVPWRGNDYKSTVTAMVYRKWSGSRINDMNIDVQHRDVFGYQLDLAHRWHVGAAMFNAGLGWRSTLPGASNNPGVVIGRTEWNGTAQALTGSLAAHAPFRIGKSQWTYSGRFQVQKASTALPISEYFTIGNRYAVRGFDGQMTLSSESGWALRNDLALQLGASAQQAYVGLDAGQVLGPAVRWLAGRTLVGAVVGVRGPVSIPHVTANYDFSLGWALKKPAGLRTAAPVLTLSVLMAF
jgi:hemolysin activation/secretion protein